jgi:tetratricopeptide (TPR) repeat protein
MKIDPARYTSGRIALANLSSSIASLERRRAEGVGFDDLVTLSQLLFLRGDLLGRISDHNCAETAAKQAAASLSNTVTTAAIRDQLVTRARLAERFHGFKEAHALLDRAIAVGGSNLQIEATRAALCQATGNFTEALALRERLAIEDRGIHTLGALATLLAEMGEWVTAEGLYVEALDADEGVSPLPCAQLLFEWGVGAMRSGKLERAEEIFVQLEAILPAHVPGCGHRAEVALARGQVEVAAALVEPLLAVSDDPAYVAIHAEILAARGDYAEAARQAQRAAASYESLLARRPEVYADQAAAFFMGVGNRPLLALELASKNRTLRDTPRSRRLLAKARQVVAERAPPARASASAHESGLMHA